MVVSKGLPGLSKSRYLHANWQLDCDYADKLSPSERQWLSQFLDEYYLSDQPTLHNREQIRERWRAFKAGAHDLMSRDHGRAIIPNESGRLQINGEDALIEKIDEEKRNHSFTQKKKKK